MKRDFRKKTLENELERYSPALAKKPRLTIYTKADLLPDPEARVAELNAELGVEGFAISSATGLNLDRLLQAAWDLLQGPSED